MKDMNGKLYEATLASDLKITGVEAIYLACPR